MGFAHLQPLAAGPLGHPTVDTPPPTWELPDQSRLWMRDPTSLHPHPVEGSREGEGRSSCQQQQTSCCPSGPWSYFKPCHLLQAALPDWHPCLLTPQLGVLRPSGIINSSLRGNCSHHWAIAFSERAILCPHLSFPCCSPLTVATGAGSLAVSEACLLLCTSAGTCITSALSQLPGHWPLFPCRGPPYSPAPILSSEKGRLGCRAHARPRAS